MNIETLPEKAAPARLALSQAEADFELLQRKAKILTSATMVSKEIRESIGNCVIIQEIAESMNAVAWQVAASIYFVHDKPAFKTSYLVARLNQSGILKGRLRYRETGKRGDDSQGLIAYGIERETGEELTGPEVTIELAKKEGWWNRSGSKWPTLTDKMLQYRAASFWISTHAPELAMGMVNYEEMQDEPKIKDVNEPIAKTKKQPQVHELFKEDEPREPEEIYLDANTGEVVDSPAYAALKAQLQAITDPKQADAFANNPLTKKITAHERKEFIQLIADKCKELRAK